MFPRFNGGLLGINGCGLTEFCYGGRVILFERVQTASLVRSLEIRRGVFEDGRHGA